ncbi:MAG: zinc metalloprotease, partial [Ferruginibacter sp.]|nr:zinc metalloprotease [Ferruginibacter sp.]
MKLFLQIVMVCFFVSGANAQRLCSSAAYNLKMKREVLARPGINSYSRDTVPNEIITIPVVIHLLFNTAAQNISDAQIRSQLKVLNEDYRRLNADAANTPAAFLPVAADTRIMFCLAQVDPAGRATRGIIRKHTDVEY